jgi:hypothetical protein
MMPQPISRKLENRLIAYSVAAGAGLATLAIAPSAEAKVVYTPANTTVGLIKSVPLDLNGDGIADFTILTRECGSHSICLIAEPAVAGNGVRGQGSIVPAGFFGVPVGPGEKFLAGTYNLMALQGGYGPYSWSGGPWVNVTGRYLGLKFVINGETHYGWARLNVNLKNLTSGGVVITGYAYETMPNTNIIEGELKSVADNIAPPDLLAPTQPMATLGMLARGADTLAIWRRNEEPILL